MPLTRNDYSIINFTNKQIYIIHKKCTLCQELIPSHCTFQLLYSSQIWDSDSGDYEEQYLLGLVVWLVPVKIKTPVNRTNKRNLTGKMYQ
jgi:hypothetical protein